MLRMTPPSARTAAPLIATACVLATNATTEATSSVLNLIGPSRLLPRACYLDSGRRATGSDRSIAAWRTPSDCSKRRKCHTFATRPIASLCRDTTRGDGGRAEPPGGGEALWRSSEHDHEDAPIFGSSGLSAT